MRIGDAAAAVGATPRALRFYEQCGLLPPPRRTVSGQRDYSSDELAVLRVIRQLLALGLTVHDLHRIADRLPRLAASPAQNCGSTKFGAPAPGIVGSTVVEQRIAALEAEISRLTLLRDALKAGLAGEPAVDAPRAHGGRDAVGPGRRGRAGAGGARRIEGHAG
ncbi:MerR family transcriptional regulator [Streptomyces sp. NPDC002088]|uniref:MerR family transcriptional regulator n=1 Tax=Streptomyces sp. NPDC002088 TaxID=3154665 RepID=UPI003317C3FA